MTKSTADLCQMEVRHLRSALDFDQFEHLRQTLDSNESWKKFMAGIPLKLADLHAAGDASTIVRKYTDRHIQKIEEAGKERNEPPFEILLEEWGTSGKKRATLMDLFHIMTNVCLFRAADYIAEVILNIPKPTRPITGLGARVDISIPIVSTGERAMKQLLSNAAYPNTSNLIDDEMMKSLQSIDDSKPINDFLLSSCIETSTDTMSEVSMQQESYYIDPDGPVGDLMAFSSRSIMVKNNDNLPHISAFDFTTEQQPDASTNQQIIPDFDHLQLDISIDQIEDAIEKTISKEEIIYTENITQSEYIPCLSLLNGR